MSIVDELGKLAELKKEGMLSDEQFERAKDQVLAASGTGVGSGDGSGIAAAPPASPAVRRLRSLTATLTTPTAKAGSVEVIEADPDEVPAEMSDSEKFLWDLQGYLTVENFLTPTEVLAINDAFDANWDKRGDCHQTPAYDEFGGMLTWEQPHCQPFRDLLAHPKLIPYMNTFFGRGWKLDHHPFMITGDMHTKQGKETSLDKDNFHGGTAVGTGGGGTMHGSTSRIHNGSQYYTYANGTMRNGMIVAAFQLRTINEGDGGFVSDETLSI